MRRNEITDHLNHLIESTLDNVHEFKTFALHAQADELRQSFERRAAALQNHIAELSDLMMEQGGKPSLHGTASGAVHRGLVRLKDAFGGLDDVDLLEESERAEGEALARYRSALDQPNLSESVRDVLGRHADALQRHREELQRQREEIRTAA